MPLRPDLYNRLRSMFKHVRIANEKEEMHAAVSRSAIYKTQQLNVYHGGEYYCVNCPFCNDTRKRLWINHRWGFYDERTGSRHLHLAICYNEDCLSIEDRRRYLYTEVFNDVSDGSDVVLPGAKAPAAAQECIIPGKLTLLDDLDRDLPDCHALSYLRSRGFDPIQLAKDLKVSYCMEANWECRLAGDRIIIPIYMNSKLTGWTARYPGEKLPTSWFPKYYSMPGMKKTQLLYNFDNARPFPFVVVCEGPTDVWRVGPSGVALFGNTLSDTQRALLTANWSTVVVLLDSDAENEAKAVYDALAGIKQRVLVQLPVNTDPGSLETTKLHQLIAAAAASQGVDLHALQSAMHVTASSTDNQAPTSSLAFIGTPQAADQEKPVGLSTGHAS